MTGPGRLLAVWAGVVGPVSFVAAWMAAGMATPGYSPVTQPVSRLAADGAPQAALMNAGFVAFAVAMPVYARALRQELPGPAWIAALTSGVATAGVAATPLGYSPRIDAAHAATAATAYLAMATLPVVASGALRRSGRRRAARASVALGVAAGASLAATGTGFAVGFFQRLGLTLVDAWIVTIALAVLRRHREPASNSPPLPAP